MIAGRQACSYDLYKELVMCRVKGYRVLPAVALLLSFPVSDYAEQDPQRILQLEGKERESKKRPAPLRLNT